MVFLCFELLWNMENLCKSVEFAPKKCGIQQFWWHFENVRKG